MSQFRAILTYEDILDDEYGSDEVQNTSQAKENEVNHTPVLFSLFVNAPT